MFRREADRVRGQVKDIKKGFPKGVIFRLRQRLEVSWPKE